MPDSIGFTAKRFHLAQLMERAAAVVPGRNIYPLLSNFLVVFGAGKVSVAATDMELTMLTESELVTCSGEGRLLLPAKRILAILHEVAEGDVSVQANGGTAVISAGHATWELVLQSAEDYPPLPSPADIEFTEVVRRDFLWAISTVRGAASRDGTNPRLMAISIDNGSVIAASHVRLHKATLPGFPLSIQLPIGAVDDLVRLLSASTAQHIAIGEAQHVLAFRIGSDVFTVGKLSSEYPDMEGRLLRGPRTENGKHLTFDRTDLIAAIRRVRITADPQTSAIGLRLAPGKVTVVSRDKNRNAAREEIPATWTDRERMITVNHESLVDLLGLTEGPQVTLRLGTDAGKRKSPLVLVDEKAGTSGVIGQLPSSMVE